MIKKYTLAFILCLCCAVWANAEGNSKPKDSVDSKDLKIEIVEDNGEDSNEVSGPRISAPPQEQVGTVEVDQGGTNPPGYYSIDNSQSQLQSDLKSIKKRVNINTCLLGIAIVVPCVIIIVVLILSERKRASLPLEVPADFPGTVPDDKDRKRTGELLNKIGAIDRNINELRKQFSSRQSDSAQKVEALRDEIGRLKRDLENTQQEADRLQTEKSQAEHNNFILTNKVKESQDEIEKANTEKNNAILALRKEEDKSKELQNQLDQEYARKQEGLPEAVRTDESIQDDLKFLREHPEVQKQMNYLFQLLTVLSSSSEKLYPQVLYELSYVLADCLRKSGSSEKGVASRLEVWAKVFNRNDYGFFIQVPRINERITPQMAVLGRSTDGLVHKINSWIIMRQNKCFLSAEVE